MLFLTNLLPLTKSLIYTIYFYEKSIFHGTGQWGDNRLRLRLEPADIPERHAHRRRGRGEGVPAHPPRQSINIIFYINKLNFQL